MPSWTQHLLGRNHACQRPSRFVFVDTETFSEPPTEGRSYSIQRLRLGVACYVSWNKGHEPREDWFQFISADEFWEWIDGKQSRGKVVWCIAHNALFDFTVLNLWVHLESGRFRIRMPGRSYRDPRTGQDRTSAEWRGLLAIDGKPFHVETWGQRGRVNFSDLFNYYTCSLGKIGQSIGLIKSPMPEQYEDDEVWFCYCKRDVQILKSAYLSLVKQWSDEDNGNWKFSAPGLAFSYYRHRHYSIPIRIHQHETARQLEWAAYYGGECRCFYRGQPASPVVHYDVNSLYPSVMAGNDYPTELIDCCYSPKFDTFLKLNSLYWAIADITLETFRDDFPNRQADRVRFPVGRYRTQLAGPELRRAVSAGAIREIHRVCWYRTARIFDSYIAYWWGQRQSAQLANDVAGADFAKLMMNSLYGKFAQRSPCWQPEPKIDVVAPWKVFPFHNSETDSIEVGRSIGWQGQRAGQRHDTAHTFPAIAAFVTAYGRERMRQLRELFPPQTIYYQDTDSLFVSDMDAPECILPERTIGDGLGQLRQVEVYKHCEFRGPKNYTCDGRHVIAGVKNRDKHLGGMRWSGERFERGPSIFSRDPDGTIRTQTIELDTPGSCAEGGYGENCWYFPLKLA